MARRGFMDLLVIPWVDKTIAIVASLPFAFELYRRWAVGHVNFPRAVLGLQLLIIIVMMVLRTAPVRVTPNRQLIIECHGKKALGRSCSCGRQLGNRSDPQEQTSF